MLTTTPPLADSAGIASRGLPTTGVVDQDPQATGLPRRDLDQPRDLRVRTQVGGNHGRFTAGVLDHPQRLGAVTDIG
jgi:hypothetical protein